MVECSKQEEKYDEGYFGKSSAVDLMDIRGNHPDKSFCFRTAVTERKRRIRRMVRVLGFKIGAPKARIYHPQ